VKEIDKILSAYNISDYEHFISYEVNEADEVISLEIFDGEYDEFPIKDNLGEFVSKFKKIKQLSIEFYNHNIEDLSLLGRLVELESIRIECDTDITNLDFLNNLSNLKSLFIQSSGVDNISGLSKNKKLEFIGLPNSKIEDISVVAKLPHLKSIGFSNNLIRQINALKRRKELVSVYLPDNDIENIDALSDCEALVRVNIANNNISDLKPVSNSKKLQFLSIANNKIKDVRFLSECQDLNHLDISDNLIERVDFLKGKNKLYYLTISNNPLSSIEPLKELKSLRRLSASNLNNIEIDKSFEFQSKLSYLELSNCNLTNASFLSNQQNLVHLNLSDNRISDFEFLKNYQLLKHLSLKNNNITTVFPAYYFFEMDGIDLRENEFGGKLYQGRSGDISYLSQIYKVNPKEQIERGSIEELDKLVADYHYEKGDYDAALAYYYINRMDKSKEIFNIYLNKLLETPDEEVVYIKYYFSVFMRNVHNAYTDIKQGNKISEKIYQDILSKFQRLPLQKTQLIKALDNAKGSPTGYYGYKCHNYEFYFYENIVDKPLITDELLYLKAHDYQSFIYKLKRENLESSLYSLKQLYERNSPYFFKLRREIFRVLKVHFASTESERKLHDDYKKSIINIGDIEVEKTKENIDLVELGAVINGGYKFVYFDKRLVSEMYNPQVQRKINRIRKPPRKGGLLDFILDWFTGKY